MANIEESIKSVHPRIKLLIKHIWRNLRRNVKICYFIDFDCPLWPVLKYVICMCFLYFNSINDFCKFHPPVHSLQLSSRHHCSKYVILCKPFTNQFSLLGPFGQSAGCYRRSSVTQYKLTWKYVFPPIRTKNIHTDK